MDVVILVFRKYVSELDAKKPVVVCGDLNVAHKEIDLKNPKTNTKNAGFTKEEREGFTTLLEAGFTDMYRLQNIVRTRIVLSIKVVPRILLFKIMF